MKISLWLALGLMVQGGECFAQTSGNIAYSQPNGQLSFQTCCQLYVLANLRKYFRKSRLSGQLF